MNLNNGRPTPGPTPKYPTGITIGHEYYPNNTAILRDVSFENNNKGPAARLDSINRYKNLRKENKKNREKTIKDINEIKKKCMNRHYKETAKNDCENFKKGYTKGIWEKIKHIRNCEDKIDQNAKPNRFQPILNNNNTLTNTITGNIDAWNEYIKDNFRKDCTDPSGPHLTGTDIDGPVIEFFLNNINTFSRLTCDEEKKKYIFENLILLAAPCSDDDILKWFKMLKARDSARLTRFFNENEEGEMIFRSLCNPFANEEILAAIKKLKNGKAIDNKRLPAEIVKQNAHFFKIYFVEIFNTVISKNAEMPSDWLNAILILLHKKESKLDRSNYRPICLVSIAYKVLTIAITSRMQPIMNLLTDCTQAAYKSKNSCADILYIFNKIIKQNREIDGDNVNQKKEKTY